MTSETTLINARVERDTIFRGKRITTLVLTYPRFIHAEIMTHRMAARNAASSRAIPCPKMLSRVESDPVCPVFWGAEVSGMQTGDQVEDTGTANDIWLAARDDALERAKDLARLGVHKSLVNRLVEPFMWITVIYTATEYANFLRLRRHKDAEIHFQHLAEAIYMELDKSTPTYRQVHAPFLDAIEEAKLTEYWVDSEENSELEHPAVHLDPIGVTLANRAAARCARVSYETHDGVRKNSADDKLATRLLNGSGFGHHSPFEHIAFAGHTDPDKFYGPYKGWEAWRRMQKNENLTGHLFEYEEAVRSV